MNELSNRIAPVLKSSGSREIIPSGKLRESPLRRKVRGLWNSPLRFNDSAFLRFNAFMKFCRLNRAVLGIGLLAFSTLGLRAGPPFVTDDPEPVDYQHWEFYIASQHTQTADGWSGTAPHFELNYGVITNVQLHLIAPLAYDAPKNGAAHYGYGNTELGVKFRFIQESSLAPGSRRVSPAGNPPPATTHADWAAANGRRSCRCGFRKVSVIGRFTAAAAMASIRALEIKTGALAVRCSNIR